ncbi:MAG: dienelactone hydrolase family protein [Myxococcales bacterium]|nr:dienelactone hydrolase family protein [Myxococcales bacterium]
MAALLVSACAHSGPAPGERPEDHYHWRPAARARGWVVFLPGSGGLEILGDDHHYFDVATRLTEEGWSVLLVDYRPAYFASGAELDGGTGEKIAWVTEQAVHWMKRAHPECADQPGAIVAWSRGAEGALRLAHAPARAAALGVGRLALYYPANEDDLPLSTEVPTLVMVGADDDVTPAAQVQADLHAEAPGARPAQLHVYPGAHHGFDVASLVQRTELRLFPLVGPKATLQYDAAAARDAEQRLLAFLAGGLERPEP